MFNIFNIQFYRTITHMVFAGDAGYPLEPWLMTLLANYSEETRHFLYTQDLCKARNVVERFFGCFKSMEMSLVSTSTDV